MSPASPEGAGCGHEAARFSAGLAWAEGGIRHEGSDDLISGFLAFNAHLGIQLQKREGECLFCRLPYRTDLAGNPETGRLFGGLLFALLDFALGRASAMRLAPEPAVATVDLRLDYTRANDSGRRLNRQIAFAGGVDYRCPVGPRYCFAQAEVTRMGRRGGCRLAGLEQAAGGQRTGPFPAARLMRSAIAPPSAGPWEAIAPRPGTTSRSEAGRSKSRARPEG